jgi:hypothetical protein
MGYCIFQSSIVHIHQSFCTSGPAAAQVKRDLKTNLQILIIIKEFYKPAETWVSPLRNLFDQCTTIREMYEVYLEWQTRLRPVGMTSLARQFRRYFDRFEGRIREPPFAVFDDLAYTQGPLPLSQIETSDIGITTGPNLDEYRERLKRLAMDLGEEDVLMQGIFNPENQDLSELYAFPQPGPSIPNPIPTQNFPNTIENSLFPILNTITTPLVEPSFNQTVLSPFGLASIHSTSSHSVPGQKNEEFGELVYDGDEIYTEMDDLFGEMPGLDGVLDPAFLEFLDGTQQ